MKKVLDQKFVLDRAYTFDDILLLPGYADFKRGEVNLTTAIHPKIVLKLPVISSPMDTVTEETMARAMAKSGGLGIIHRNLSIGNQAGIVSLIKKDKLLVGAAIGPGADFDERLSALVNVGTDLIVVDSGHGYTKFVMDAVKKIKARYPSMVVMAGNIATKEGAVALIKAGADILRVGMGPGSICTTRIITGMGVPQLFAIEQAVRAIAGTKVTVVADGGIRQTGDIAKALAFGSHAVMLGSMLARFDESPGDVISKNGKKFKIYRGMGSIAAMKKGGAERYGQTRNTEEKKLIAEGVEGLVPYQGRVADFLYQVEGSLRSSFYYLGAKNLKELFIKSKAIVITQASLSESHPHTVQITNAGKNYL